MSELFQAINNTTTTTNGMSAYQSSLSANLDLFFVIGTARGEDVWNVFAKAYQENPNLAVRILLWSRDIREGAGERQRFRDILMQMSRTEGYQELIVSVIKKIPEVGRWDDLFSLMNTEYESQALQIVAEGIKNGDGLAAKWSPRKGPIAVKLREVMKLTPKGYRKTIVNLTKVVEQQMCSGQWDKIEYSHVPSIASKIYRQAFRRHDENRYDQYLDAVINGEKKMNASAIFPHQIVEPFLGYAYNLDAKQAEAQWKSLPNYLEGVDERILTVCDVSGSMHGMPMNVSVGLGLYFSERLEGVFKDCIVTFSANPQFVKVKGNTLIDRVNNLSRADWGMNTDIEAVFQKLLATAVREKVGVEHMPTKVLIISDMQFDQCSRNTSETMFQMLERKYAEAGYEMPNLVFWNVASANNGNVPVTKNKQGVALVSGSSPSVVQSVLGGEIDPIKVMLKTVMKDRYTV